MQKRFKIIATIGVISLLVICWFSAAARACCVGTQPPCKVCEQQPGGEWIWVNQCVVGQVCCDGECVTGDCCGPSNCTGCQDCTNHYCVKKSTVGCDDNGDCTSCQECDENCDCVKKSTVDCDEDSDCGDCQTCNEDCECEDDNSKCAEGQECVDGKCTCSEDADCNTVNCEHCEKRICEYKCAEGQECVEGECTCDSAEDCLDCEECGEDDHCVEDCGEGESCCGGECCGNTCCGGACCAEGKGCVNDKCACGGDEDCDTVNCEHCKEGVCESKCAEGQECVEGECTCDSEDDCLDCEKCGEDDYCEEDCGEGESCCGGECCGNTCCGGACCAEGKGCVDDKCACSDDEDCDTDNCEHCKEGVCESKCAEGMECSSGGECICSDDSQCLECEECLDVSCQENCDEGKSCCGGECCTDGKCCAGVCCGEDQECRNEECCDTCDSNCCDPEDETCCDGDGEDDSHCCSNSEICCDDLCCEAVCCNDSEKTGDAHCCDEAGKGMCCRQTCCDEEEEKCCSKGDGDNDGYCCPSIKDCCDGDCCDPEAQKCCDDIEGDGNGYCCGVDLDGEETCCKGTCCAPDKCCMDDTCVAVNLGINGVSEEDEEDPGGYVGVNNDDDNNNGTADKDESGTVSGEDDLVSISLSISPSADTGQATLSATAGGSKIKVWENSTKGTEVSLPKSWDLSSESVPGTLYVEGISASSDDRDIELKLSLNGSGSCDDKIRFTCIEARKIPLGSSANLSKFIIGKVYEPTKYGGKLILNGGTSKELFYTDGSDSGPDKAIDVFNDDLDAYIVATGNPCEYDVPEDDHGWYYVKITDTSLTSVSSSFSQSETVSKSPWICSWYAMSDEWGSPNLYDTNHSLDKYDTAYGTDSVSREKRHRYFGAGDYVAKSTAKESDAERTWGYDIDNDDGDNDVWTGWDANYSLDFWNGTWPMGDFGIDGDTTDEVDVSWWGHCDMSTAVIIWESEPGGNYYAPNSVVFTPTLKKGLLVALYHGFTLGGYGPDILPHLWHGMLEDCILKYDVMFGADVYNSGSGPDTVWNYPIYSIQNASYKEKTGQSDPKVVQITCTVSCWKGCQTTLYYKYNVKYHTNGFADTSSSSDWLEHPSAPADEKKPDTAWFPGRQTSIDYFWNGELNYNSIKTIIPL